MAMEFDIKSLIGEATAYDKKQMLEIRRPKSWLKSVSAFANGEGGVLIFGISDDYHVLGLVDAEGDAEKISEEIKSKLDPVPTVRLELKEADGKKLVLLHVYPGQETPYYYIGDKQRLAFVRIWNESVVADRIQLKSLVLKGAGRTYDSLPSNYRFEDMAFSKLRSVHYKRLQRSFEDSEFVSWGIVDENGNLTNAGAGEAIDDVELEGCVIGQLQDAASFVRNNSKKKWWKESDHREELPDYPEHAVTEAIANAIIHRDYMQLGSEIHIDMYDDRMEIYSPGGMMDGRLIQQLNPLTVPSKRRNPLLADFFSRLGLMERRGSGMKKIIDSYKRFERLSNFHAPEFQSNASEFHVILWNLNYGNDGVMSEKEFLKEVSGTEKEFLKEDNKFRKEFLKAQRMIYKMISSNPGITIAEMATNIGVSDRQVRKYLKRMTDMKFIVREGGRKNGKWKIIDGDYEDFFERI